MGTLENDDDSKIVGDVDDLHQYEPEDYNIKAVPVNVEGPVRVQFQPSRTATMRQVTLTTTAELILPEDPRRSRAFILPTDGDIYFGTRNDIQNARAFRLPDPIGIDITHGDAVWAAAVTGTVVTSIMVENWAD